MSTDQTAWHFLLNPAAGRGKAKWRWQKWLPLLQTALPNMTVSCSTREAGMAALAEAAVLSGKTFIVGVGGDGTHHDVVNGIVRAGGLGTVTYAPLPLGTGNDWVRTLRTPRKPAAWLKMLRQKKLLRHRVGKLSHAPLAESATPPAASSLVARSCAKNLKLTDYSSGVPPSTLHPPPTTTYYFINVAGLAYDAEVVRRSEKARFKHRFLYPFLTLWYLKDFNPPVVKITYDGTTMTCPVHTVNLGIGRYNGGGMRLVPHAEPTAETFALTVARKLPIWKIILSSWRFYTGTIGAIEEVTTASAQHIHITPDQEIVALEADGELLGVAPVTATMMEEYLRVVVP